jgi:hypothetical protein
VRFKTAGPLRLQQSTHSPNGGHGPTNFRSREAEDSTGYGFQSSPRRPSSCAPGVPSDHIVNRREDEALLAEVFSNEDTSTTLVAFEADSQVLVGLTRNDDH